MSAAAAATTEAIATELQLQGLGHLHPASLLIHIDSAAIATCRVVTKHWMTKTNFYNLKTTERLPKNTIPVTVQMVAEWGSIRRIRRKSRMRLWMRRL